MDDSTFKFILSILGLCFTCVFLVDWVYRRFDPNKEERETERLMKEIRRNAKRQDEERERDEQG